MLSYSVVFIKKGELTTDAYYGLRQPSIHLKSDECFPDLPEIPSYLETNEYVRQI